MDTRPVRRPRGRPVRHRVGTDQGAEVGEGRARAIGRPRLAPGQVWEDHLP